MTCYAFAFKDIFEFEKKKMSLKLKMKSLKFNKARGSFVRPSVHVILSGQYHWKYICHTNTLMREFSLPCL